MSWWETLVGIAGVIVPATLGGVAYRQWRVSQTHREREDAVANEQPYREHRATALTELLATLTTLEVSARLERSANPRLAEGIRAVHEQLVRAGSLLSEEERAAAQAWIDAVVRIDEQLRLTPPMREQELFADAATNAVLAPQTADDFGQLLNSEKFLRSRLAKLLGQRD